jgi:hypothetical protein
VNFETENAIKRDMFEKCYDHFNETSTIMLSEAIVKSSIQDHIDDFEKYHGRNVAVYSPAMALAKEVYRMELANDTCSVDERSAKRKKVNAVPEGYVLRSWNLDTGKHTGIESCNKKIGNPFSTMYDSIALHGSCGVPTELLVVVRGPKIGNEKHKDSGLQHVYCRKITLDPKISSSGKDDDLRTYVDATNVKCMDWATIGVHPQKLKRLKFKCLPLAGTAKKEGIEVRVASSQNYDDDANDEPASEINEFVHNVKPSTFFVSAMPKYEEFEPWDSYKHLPQGQNGKTKKPCYVFKFKGYRYMLPADHYVNTHNYVDGRVTGAVLLVRNTEHGLELKAPDTDDGYIPDRKKVSGEKADNIPTHIEPMRILGGTSKSLCKGNSATVICLENPDKTVGHYYLPYHLRAQINVTLMQRLGGDPLDGKALTGFKILRPEKRKERVNGSKNRVEEVLLTILSPDGSVVAESVPCVPRQKRKREAEP